MIPQVLNQPDMACQSWYSNMLSIAFNVNNTYLRTQFVLPYIFDCHIRLSRLYQYTASLGHLSTLCDIDLLPLIQAVNSGYTNSQTPTVSKLD